MKNLAIMSDLHIDSNAFSKDDIQTLVQLLQEEKISHLHIAGDISNSWADLSLPFLEEIASQIPVSFNLGNHDMLGLSEEDIQKEQIKALDFGDFHLVAIDGWYDYSFVPQISPEEHLANKKLFWFDRRLKREKTDPEITDQLITDLEEKLAELKGPIILAMHFVPHEQFILDHPYFQRFNAFLGSQKWHHVFTQYPITDVIFGHTHHRFPTTKIDGVSYHCRPLGYQREWRLVEDFFRHYPHYKIDKMYHLHKRFAAIRSLPEYQDFRRKHLKEELQAAMTIIPYGNS